MGTKVNAQNDTENEYVQAIYEWVDNTILIIHITWISNPHDNTIWLKIDWKITEIRRTIFY